VSVCCMLCHLSELLTSLGVVVSYNAVVASGYCRGYVQNMWHCWEACIICCSPPALQSQWLHCPWDTSGPTFALCCCLQAVEARALERGWRERAEVAEAALEQAKADMADIKADMARQHTTLQVKQPS